MLHFVPQSGKSGKVKMRLIYCPPLAITVLEIFFFYNVTQHFNNNDDSAITQGYTQISLFNLVKGSFDSAVISGDFSNYDHTLPSEFMCLALKVFFELTDFGKFSKHYYFNLYSNLCSYILHSPFYHPTLGNVRRKRGILSGTVVTNLLDSCCNLITIGYAFADRLHLVKKVLVSGDDNVIITSELFDKDYLKSVSDRIFMILGMLLKYNDEDMYPPDIKKINFLGST
jgi:hypothetical protein